MSDYTVEKIIAETFNQMADSLETGVLAKPVKIAVTGIGSEHGEQNVLEGAALAASRDVEVIYIGTIEKEGIKTHKAQDEKQAHKIMEELLENGKADAAVTMHYAFPIGVSTVGRAITPGKGKEMFIASTTGTSSVKRGESMAKNAVYGMAAAKACGIKSPTVGILNIDGARQAEQALKKMQQNGYEINFAESARSDKGCIMRGNDLLLGQCDVMVCDSLTGNILMKTLSSFTTGGDYESVGYGYGPGIGEGHKNIIMIISRASGAPVVAGAVKYAAQLVRGDLSQTAANEISMAKKAGMNEIDFNPEKSSSEDVKTPPKEVVVHQIAGIEIMDLEDAVKSLWKEGIYAESGMGCTGPIILVSESKADDAGRVLKEKGWLA